MKKMRTANYAKNDFELIIPVASKDINTAIDCIPYIFENISPKKIIIISNKRVQKEIINSGYLIDFLDEDKIIDGLSYSKLFEYLKKFNAEKRTGWYFQQFIKMAYCYCAKTDYYLVWDADTIPIRKLYFFDKNKPIFSMKKELHEAYFDTINSLLGLKKSTKLSFIAEHMLFKTTYMKELIEEISRHDKWYFNIINSIRKNDLPLSGFSEFETYGTYVINYHKGVYIQKKYHSLRNGKELFGNIPNKEVVQWISKNYSAISFEKSQTYDYRIKFYKNSLFRKLVKPALYFRFVSILRKYKE